MRPDPELHQLATATAKALGDQWHTDDSRPDHHPSEHIAHPDGRIVRIARDLHRHPGRLSFMALYPPSRFGPDGCRITVRADRGPDVFAAEITRRILPRYAVELARVRAYLAAVARYEAFRRAAVDRLTAIPGTEDRYDGTVVTWSRGNARARVTFTGLHGGTTNLQLDHIPAAAAVEVLARLAAMDPEPGATASMSPRTGRPATGTAADHRGPGR